MKLFYYSIAATLLLTLSACGGGGQGAPENPALGNPALGSPAAGDNQDSDSDQDSAQEGVPPADEQPGGSDQGSSSGSDNGGSEVPVQMEPLSLCGTASHWALQPETSFVGFTSLKNRSTMEAHDFSSLSGSIDPQGKALLNVDLASVQTGITLRNQRLVQELFKVEDFPSASIEVQVSDAHQLPANGKTRGDSYQIFLSLHGRRLPLDAELSVTCASNKQLLVATQRPLIISVADFAMTDGLQTLSALAGGIDISPNAAVDVALVFSREQ